MSFVSMSRAALNWSEQEVGNGLQFLPVLGVVLPLRSSRADDRQFRWTLRIQGGWFSKELHAKQKFDKSGGYVI